eukprot:12030376-Ditylum_brightwellii.AAC.1
MFWVPIGEGYKLFTLCKLCGCIINFTSDGRSAAKLQQQEHKTSCLAGKIESMILHMVSIISHLCDKQKSWSSSKATQQQVRATNNNIPMEKSRFAMDIYFTLPKVISGLHIMGINVVGTSCFRQGWPIKKICNVKQQDVNFNDVYWCID